MELSVNGQSYGHLSRYSSNLFEMLEIPHIKSVEAWVRIADERAASSNSQVLWALEVTSSRECFPIIRLDYNGWQEET